MEKDFNPENINNLKDLIKKQHKEDLLLHEKKKKEKCLP